MPTLPKIFRPVTQNTLIFYLALPNLTLVMLNIFCTSFLPKFYPVNLQHSTCVFRVKSSVDPDQMASLEAS